jgi:hypothetical protein
VIACIGTASEEGIKDGPLTEIQRPLGDKLVGQEQSGVEFRSRGLLARKRDDGLGLLMHDTLPVVVPELVLRKKYE